MVSWLPLFSLDPSFVAPDFALRKNITTIEIAYFDCRWPRRVSLISDAGSLPETDLGIHVLTSPILSTVGRQPSSRGLYHR